MIAKCDESFDNLRNETSNRISNTQHLLLDFRQDLDRLDKKPAFFTNYKTIPEPRSMEDVYDSLREFVVANAETLGTDPIVLENFIREVEAEMQPVVAAS